MYLDQPGLMGLWSRAKAVFAPKKHTHQASEVSGVIADGTEMMTTNPFSPFPNLYISKIDNAFYAADKRFSVVGEITAPDGTVSESNDCSALFDGDYETSFRVEDRHKLVVRMTFPNEWGKTFPGYPYGNIIVSFYYNDRPKSVSMRVYNSYEPQGVGWHDLSGADISTSAIRTAWSFRNPYYRVQQFELTVVGDGGGSDKITMISQVEMHLDRPSPERNPVVGKYSKERLYYPLTAPSFIGGLQGNADTATEIKAQAGVNASLEKLPVWTATPTDTTQLVRRDTGNTATYGRVTFLTVWNYIKGKADTLYAPKKHTHQASDITGLPSSGGVTPADYVVAQGICDFWRWRMWSSGVAECWGCTGETNDDVSNEWEYLYEGTAWYNGFPGNTSVSSALLFSVKIDGKTYSKLFRSTPDFCSCSFIPTGGTGISGIEIGGGLSAMRTPTVYLLRPAAATVTGCYSYHAKGRWK